jgi:flavin reductase (DIM6/NTAB) family NADH-FMN oxidoreductase RutF
MTNSFDVTDFRQTLGRFATGVTVVTALYDGEVHGMTANSFTAVSLAPPLVLVSVDNRARMQQILPRHGRYGISILHADQQHISAHFAGRPTAGFSVDFDWFEEMPLIAGALAQFVCSIRDSVSAGDHTLHIGHVDEFRRHKDEPTPLIFFGSRYATVNAPSPAEIPLL